MERGRQSGRHEPRASATPGVTESHSALHSPGVTESPVVILSPVALDSSVALDSPNPIGFAKTDKER